MFLDLSLYKRYKYPTKKTTNWIIMKLKTDKSFGIIKLGSF
ncbi:hypothetical protein BN174_4090003 [Clostridioides difficile E15]|nr:hypothetical protein BN174_4090003 [Clostridioides difficile E15]